MPGGEVEGAGGLPNCPGQWVIPPPQPLQGSGLVLPLPRAPGRELVVLLVSSGHLSGCPSKPAGVRGGGIKQQLTSCYPDLARSFSELGGSRRSLFPRAQNSPGPRKEVWPCGVPRGTSGFLPERFRASCFQGWRTPVVLCPSGPM